MRNDLTQLLWPGMRVSYDHSLNTAKEHSRLKAEG